MNEKIKKLCKDVDVSSSCVVIDRLSKILSEEQLEQVLEIVWSTCPYCWDTDTNEGWCYCRMDD